MVLTLNFVQGSVEALIVVENEMFSTSISIPAPEPAPAQAPAPAPAPAPDPTPAPCPPTPAPTPPLPSNVEGTLQSSESKSPNTKLFDKFVHGVTAAGVKKGEKQAALRKLFEANILSEEETALQNAVEEKIFETTKAVMTQTLEVERAALTNEAVPSSGGTHHATPKLTTSPASVL